MIEVRIRHQDATESAFLCTWPANELDGIIPAIKRWGEVPGYDTCELYGQFQYDEDANQAFFEIVLADTA